LKTLIGQQWGNYRLIRLLGRGGFAEVYLGEHVRLGMRAAVKILHTFLSEKAASSFQQEAQVIAELAHPHIVRVLDFDIKDGKPFVVLEHAPNGSLSQRHPRGIQVSLPTVVDYIGQVASALQYAHEKKLIHRDIKPENMLIGRRGEILLSDFGLATIAHSTMSMDAQSSLGTLAYMAPEQIQGYPRAASDQYALGIVAYQWLSGGAPFRGSSTEIIAQHLGAAPHPLRELAPQVSEEVEWVIYKALAKDPRARFGSVLALAIALQQAATRTGQPVARSETPRTLQTRFLEPTVAQIPSLVPPSAPLQVSPSSYLEALPSGTNSVSDVQAKAQSTVTMATLSMSPSRMGRYAVPPEDRLASSNSSLSTTPTEIAVSPRPRGTKRVIFLVLALVLLLGGAGLWYLLTALHPASNGIQFFNSNNTNIISTPGGSVPTPITNPNTQPTSATTPTATSAPGVNCIHGSTADITVSQIAGATVSLPGSAATLTNCGSTAGHWTLATQINDGKGWISCSPIGGDIPANSAQDIHIVVGSSTALIGTYTAQLTFTMGSALWVINVTLIVIA
jgi:serine/threonine protein kinase